MELNSRARLFPLTRARFLTPSLLLCSQLRMIPSWNCTFIIIMKKGRPVRMKQTSSGRVLRLLTQSLTRQWSLWNSQGTTADTTATASKTQKLTGRLAYLKIPTVASSKDCKLKRRVSACSIEVLIFRLWIFLQCQCTLWWLLNWRLLRRPKEALFRVWSGYPWDP